MNDADRFAARAPEEGNEWDDEFGGGGGGAEICDLASSAERLGSDGLVMEGYSKFQNKERGWFFSPNPNLVSATPSPKRTIDNWSDWKNLHWKQQRVLANIMGEPNEKIEKTDSNLEKVVEALKIWRRNLYAVFWSIPDGYDTEAYTCNIFVGDSLYLCGKNIINSENKYYSAKQIYNAIEPFALVNKKNVKRGNIVAFSGVHLEIVTKVYTEENWFSADEKVFCSRGGGRASSEMGTEKCGTAWFETDRRINVDDIHFLTI